MSCLTYCAWLLLCTIPSCCSHDGPRITALLGESIVLHCPIDFPEGQIVPYIIQWTKQDRAEPLYIWYEGYRPHVSEEYEGRVSRVMNDGQASLNVTNVISSDQGWYECQVLFLKREPRNSQRNGTWVYLDVHAPPRFLITPDDIVYVNIGDSIILSCEAEGTPQPRITWYKESSPVRPSPTIAIMNEGSELRITDIKEIDIGDYVCIAKNSEGRIHHSTKVVIAGSAIILVPPQNITKIEGDKTELACDARGMPSNISIMWFKNSEPVHHIESLEGRVAVKKDGTLVIHPLTSYDSGKYTCQVTNGIGSSHKASAYLNVEYPARVHFTPSVQYLPFRMRGIVHCPIEANPPLKIVTWIKDRRVFKPSAIPEVVQLKNGSLLFHKVSHDHEGEYQCTPYNAVGTAGSSELIQVLVREPPVFTIRPSSSYQQKKGRDIILHCVAEGNPRPNISWRRHDGKPLPKTRSELKQGNLTIRSLREEDFACYECIASNEIATIVSSTQLLIEGTRPQPPQNISFNASHYSISLNWLPGYSGGEDYVQEYLVWYNEAGDTRGRISEKVPPGRTSLTVYHLMPNTSYEFEIISRNRLGEGTSSVTIVAATQAVGSRGAAVVVPSASPSPQGIKPAGAEESSISIGKESIFQDVIDYSMFVLPRDSFGRTYFPVIRRATGPKPNPPRDLNITEVSNGIRFSWLPPVDNDVAIGYYTIDYKLMADSSWKRLNPTKIEGKTEFVERNMAGLLGERSYEFRVNAHSMTNYASSNTVKFVVPARLKHKAIIAGVVGGILFFFVAIILSVCAVKICNKRKRRRHEKAYSIVACRMSETRNGGHIHSTSPLQKKQSIGVSFMKLYNKFVYLKTRVSAFIVFNTWRKKQRENETWTLERIPKAVQDRPDGQFVFIDNNISVSSDEGGFSNAKWKPFPFQSSDSHRIFPSELRCFRTSSPTTAAFPETLTNDLSSVRQPSSAERSFPSTVISSERAGSLIWPACQKLTPTATNSPPHSNFALIRPSVIKNVCQPHYVNFPYFNNSSKITLPFPISAYTRDQLQAAIGRVRSGFFLPAFDESLEYRTDDHLSNGSVSSGRGSAKLFPAVDLTQESTSSGIASRNVSFQPTQNSFPEIESLTELNSRTRAYRPFSRRDNRFAPYPFISLSDHGFDSPGGLGSSHSECSPLTMTLDASVDAHYEFDTAHYPFTSAKMFASDNMCGSKGHHSGSNVSNRATAIMEARLQAMRQEYQAFVKRQVELGSSRRPLETLC